MPTGLGQMSVRQLWREVKQDGDDEEDFWGDLKGNVLGMVKRLLESGLEQEMVGRLGVEWYGRKSSRKGYRNGSYQRNIFTEFGMIENLRVPRAREGMAPTKLLESYRQRQGKVNDLIREMFLAGVSTRRVGEILERILGRGVSAQTVSNVARSLDREVAAYLTRPLEDHYRYLLLDGLTLRLKSAAGVKTKLVLVAYGITENMHKEIICFQLATSESEAQWQAFLNHLYQRGLEGRKLQMAITDGCPGLHKALEMVFPYVLKQRCWVHKLRNVATKLPKKVEKDCLKEAKQIYLAKNEREARKYCREWGNKWREVAPNAVKCLEQDMDELVSFLSQPKALWRKLRTTNAIERSFREIRRRTRPMSCFNNKASCMRIIFSVVNYLNTKWQDTSIVFTQPS
jgi:putative transposase